MPADEPTALSLAKEFAQQHAGKRLTPHFAKLYSQHTRLRTGQEGLSLWRPGESEERLADAVQLVEVSAALRESGDAEWREPLRRAGEILEWLGHPSLNRENLPLRLLSGAAYQLAGYPARADGLLRSSAPNSPESIILNAFLTARFEDLLKELTKYWASNIDPAATLAWNEHPGFHDNLSDWVVQETCSSLGVLCSAMRWQNEDRADLALKKLAAVSNLLLHGHDQFSWLLSKLCVDVGRILLASSMRKHVSGLGATLTQPGKQAIENYIRLNYRAGRSLVWPSQIRGIESLASSNSFALCTPTGSGKTTIAELAIIQSLFKPQEEAAPEGRLAMYLVPSRALAVEVEARMARVLSQLTAEPIIVTGLYGGIDWGPTDAWLTREDPTVLICTYEKADALLRFLGPLFVKRISLLIIDEAHSVQFDGRESQLQSGENRSLRLESLGARLFSHLELGGNRVIGLSAVAGAAEPAIARWITGENEASAVSVKYRSTRQLIGRLECHDDRRFYIRYDLLDGSPLQFEDTGRSDAPYIPDPFPRLPSAPRGESPEARLRTHALWAALHLASGGESGIPRSILISITQDIGPCAAEYLRLFDEEWRELDLPSYFKMPDDAKKRELFEQCIRSCEDYFGSESREYKLLHKGIVVHHGKMPGIMARLLVELIQERVFNVVVATSTLSEGVNLPFETILIPSLRRAMGHLSVREFANLAGRAGRPGHGTEGQTLVLLEQESLDRGNTAFQRRRSRTAYTDLINGLISPVDDPHGMIAVSPLANLLRLVREKWNQITVAPNDAAFLAWIEEAAPLNEPEALGAERKEAIETLDSLDAILLAAIAELEQLTDVTTPDELERQLKDLWGRTYARYASIDEQALGATFAKRGRAIHTEIYPDAAVRSRLYRSSLPPREAKRLSDILPEAVEYLRTGDMYATWHRQQRVAFIEGVVERIARVPKFSCPPRAGRRNVDWRHALRWWLDPTSAEDKPEPNEIADWHSYVSQQFNYRFSWGLGSLVAVVLDDAHQGELKPLTLEDWPETGLPWIIFWTKELLTWGTLDPLVAYILSRGRAVTRAEAEVMAASYYSTRPPNVEPNEIFNATTINRWSAREFQNEGQWSAWEGPVRIPVRLLRVFNGQARRKWRVVPVQTGLQLRWLDVAGFPLAQSETPENWEADRLNSFDFFLDPQRRSVTASAY